MCPQNIVGRRVPVFMAISENIFQCELHDSRIPGTTGARVPGAGDFPESLAVSKQARIVGIHVICQVDIDF